MKQLTYSILIPTCNRAAILARMLASIKTQTRLPNEVVIIDQSDGDDTRKLFEAWKCEGIAKKYIYRSVKSLILARNAGIDGSAEVDLVSFIDDDVVLQPRFCEELVKVFEADVEKKYAGGMGTIEGARFRTKPLQRFFFMPREGDGNFLPSGAPTLCHWRKDFREVEFISGGITFWRKVLIQKYRFDERLVGYGYGDDVDVSYRISRNHKLFYQPAAICFHDEHSPGRDKSRAYRRGWTQNMFYLAQKNGISIPAFSWCVVGLLMRDLVCVDFPGMRGTLEAVAKIARGKIDTVVGYQDFVRSRRRTNST